MTNFSKADLAAAVSGRIGLSKAATAEAIDAIMLEIKIQAYNGKKVNIPGFGKFEIKQRAARTGRNPKTGEAVEIAASSTLGFRPSKVGS